MGDSLMARHLKLLTTREDLRHRRTREVRPKTESMLRLPKRDLELGRMLFPVDPSSVRPRVRGDCVDGVRPCPFVACRHHLYLEAKEDGSAIKYNFPDLEVDELDESCALDVADDGPKTLETVAALMNIVREAVRQIEIRAKALLVDGLLAHGGGS